MTGALKHVMHMTKVFKLLDVRPKKIEVGLQQR